MWPRRVRHAARWRSHGGSEVARSRQPRNAPVQSLSQAAKTSRSVPDQVRVAVVGTGHIDHPGERGRALGGGLVWGVVRTCSSTPRVAWLARGLASAQLGQPPPDRTPQRLPRGPHSRDSTSMVARWGRSCPIAHVTARQLSDTPGCTSAGCYSTNTPTRQPASGQRHVR